MCYEKYSSGINLIYSRLEQDLTLMKVKMTLSLALHNLRGRLLELLKLPWLKHPKVNHCLLFWPSLDQTILILLIWSPRMISFKSKCWVKIYIFTYFCVIYKFTSVSYVQNALNFSFIRDPCCHLVAETDSWFALVDSWSLGSRVQILRPYFELCATLLWTSCERPRQVYA